MGFFRLRKEKKLTEAEQQFLDQLMELDKQYPSLTDDLEIHKRIDEKAKIAIKYDSTYHTHYADGVNPMDKSKLQLSKFQLLDLDTHADERMDKARIPNVHERYAKFARPLPSVESESDSNKECEME